MRNILQLRQFLPQRTQGFAQSNAKKKNNADFNIMRNILQLRQFLTQRTQGFAQSNAKKAKVQDQLQIPSLADFFNSKNARI